MVIEEADPVANDTAGVLYAFEAVSVCALFFQRSDDAFYHAVLLWAVRCDELLFQTVVSNQRGEVATCKN